MTEKQSHNDHLTDQKATPSFASRALRHPIETAQAYLFGSNYDTELGFKWDTMLGHAVLDIGAGSAGLARDARAHGVKVVSLDPHPETWNVSKKSLNGLSYVQGDSLHLPFADESFDHAVSRLTVKYVVLPKDEVSDKKAYITEKFSELFSEVGRVLKHDGEFRFDIDDWGETLFPRSEMSDIDPTNNEQYRQAVSEKSLEFLQAINPHITMERIGSNQYRDLTCFKLTK